MLVRVSKMPRLAARLPSGAQLHDGNYNDTDCGPNDSDDTFNDIKPKHVIKYKL